MYCVHGQAWKLWREGNALALLDKVVAIGGDRESEEVLRCVQVGLLCVQERPEDRPHMATVFLMLANLSAVMPQPRHPGYCSDRGSITSQHFVDALVKEQVIPLQHKKRLWWWCATGVTVPASPVTSPFLRQ